MHTRTHTHTRHTGRPNSRRRPREIFGYYCPVLCALGLKYSVYRWSFSSLTGNVRRAFLLLLLLLFFFFFADWLFPSHVFCSHMPMFLLQITFLHLCLSVLRVRMSEWRQCREYSTAAAAVADSTSGTAVQVFTTTTTAATRSSFNWIRVIERAK